jgi:hypothetical protein
VGGWLSPALLGVLQPKANTPERGCGKSVNHPRPPSTRLRRRLHTLPPHTQGAGQTTCEALTALAEAQGVSLLVVGSFGRKGEKTFDMLGTVSDYSLRESHCSVCVVRSTSPPANDSGGGDYLFATDGSQASALAFCSLVRQ